MMLSERVMVLLFPPNRDAVLDEAISASVGGVSEKYTYSRRGICADVSFNSYKAYVSVRECACV